MREFSYFSGVLLSQGAAVLTVLLRLIQRTSSLCGYEGAVRQFGK
ncbi:MAG: hypothetical protein AAF960_07940 [Bacteroidota bacterium]